MDLRNSVRKTKSALWRLCCNSQHSIGCVRGSLNPKARSATRVCGATRDVCLGPKADIITGVGLILLPKFLCILPVLPIKIFRFQGSQINPVNASHIDVDLVRIRAWHIERMDAAVLAECVLGNASVERIGR